MSHDALAAAADPAPVSSDDASAEQAGLAHVATASFIASRVVPTGGFAVALAGGVALARVGQQVSARIGYGASLAATLQAVAVMGPLRVGIPLTQALSAPLLGRMFARGASLAAALVACGVIRFLDQIVTTAFYIWVVAGGIDTYAATYDALTGNIPGVPQGASAALVATAVGLMAWTLFATIVQVLVYRAALAAWPEEGEAGTARAGRRRGRDVGDGAAGDTGDTGDTSDAAGAAGDTGDTGDATGTGDSRAAHDVSCVRRYDPRAVAAAASVAFVALLVSTAWVLLGAVAVWLAGAWATARGDSEPVRPGLALGALLAFGALVFGLVGNIGIELTFQRTVRVMLLVLVATWLRAAAGEQGLREVFRRTLPRVGRVPGIHEAAAILDRLGTTGALTASARSLVETVRHVQRRPQPLAAAVLDWIATEAARFTFPRETPAARLRMRGSDLALVIGLIAATAAAKAAALV